MSLTSQEQRVCDLIAKRSSALLEDLRLHVGIPTGLGHRAGLDESRERFTQRLAKLGATVTLIPGDPKEPWLYGKEPADFIPPTAVARRQTGENSVLLCGHLDTVHDPRSPFNALTISSDGKTATGPGCVDMKGGLVIAVAALEALEEAGVRTSWGFILNSDEETGSYHSGATLRAEAAAGYAYGLVLEPATPEGGLVIERPGSGQFMIEAHGKAAHVGRDFKAGVSAVTALAKCIVRCAELADPDAGRIVNIGPLEGGVAANVVPDRARAWGNVRFTSAEVGEELGRLLEAMETPGDGLPRVRVRRSFNRPAKPRTEATESLALKARAAAEDLGQPLPFVKTGGVCDGNNLQAAGLPTIDTLGVRGGGLHTTSEWIELASLVERCQLLAVLMMRLSQSGA
jgi:glutamate carboxypeptidase